MNATKRKALIVLMLLCAGVNFAQTKESVTYTGYLVDVACAAVHRTADQSWAVVHKRDCLTSPQGQKSGFALATKGKIFRFDAAGNAKAVALINKEHREDHWLVEVVGQPQAGRDGEMIAVQSIRLQ